MADEIIEKKPSSPVATSLLGISAACIIGALIIQGMQLKKYQIDGAESIAMSASVWENKQLSAHKAEATKFMATKFDKSEAPDEPK
ncbi:MAG: hypothetical protein ACKVX7_02500 [Planctomycetota bacterium]